MSDQGNVEPKIVISKKKKTEIIIGIVMLIVGSIIFVIGWVRTLGDTGDFHLLDQGGTISLLGSFPMAFGLGIISYNWYNESRPKSSRDAQKIDKSMD